MLHLTYVFRWFFKKMFLWSSDAPKMQEPKNRVFIVIFLWSNKNKYYSPPIWSKCIYQSQDCLTRILTLFVRNIIEKMSKLIFFLKWTEKKNEKKNTSGVVQPKTYQLAGPFAVMSHYALTIRPVHNFFQNYHTVLFWF